MISAIIIFIILCWILISGVFLGTLLSNRRRNEEVMSFMESLNLTNVPVVTFKEGKVKLNFLLDTGASESYISESASKMLLGTPVDTDYSCTTGSGQSNSAKMIEACLTYKKSDYKQDLFIMPSLDESFAKVKKESGVQIHGILGSNFFSKYNYVLDFDEMVAYSKK